MLKALTLSQIFVLDQDEALDFYVGKLGLEVAEDVDLGFMRWLTVTIPGSGRRIMLEKPGPPAHDETTAAQVRELVTKGATGGWLGFEVDDIHQTYRELLAKGVEITQEPTEQAYGTDFGFRDPFGNAIRVNQPKI
ncbi:VOC family protein [Amycolatopsis sp. H20-H5]|uniref:VOC family protein n=1 Tax=Amycolatopsis sp. H20-H5 TaxID=3046309 RepID=UPI002DB6562E|nr:VOC family protein [Amycolatopsis sp. H20-H5]MEC3975652.1 VOC family protein [Amycolatopsis sp. H20-H5]